MNFFCCSLAMLALVSSIQCLYIQEAHEMPRIQALARIGERPTAAVPERTRVIIQGQPTYQPTQYRTYVDPAYSTYGTNTMARDRTILINIAEDQDPVYAAVPQAMPARTTSMRI